MKRIFKYTLEQISNDQIVTVKGTGTPGTGFLSVMPQNDCTTVVYFLVDDSSKETSEYHFVLKGTGHAMSREFPEEYDFVGTVSLHQSKLMLHAFMKKGEVTQDV